MKPQLVEQRLGFDEIQRVEALGERAVDRAEQVGGLLPFAALGEKPCQVSGGAQLQRECLLLPRNLERALQVGLGRGVLAAPARSNNAARVRCSSAAKDKSPLSADAAKALVMCVQASSCRPAREQASAVML